MAEAKGDIWKFQCDVIVLTIDMTIVCSLVYRTYTLSTITLLSIHNF